VNPPSGTSNLDERPGFENSDDQRAPGNTNDLRGKILRIHPEDDGSYTIPEGNLFPKGTPKTRPEIYTMGHRNPWRISIDSKTGYVYWGEVGPDASVDTKRGPRGYDEFNQAKGPGFFGWPYFIGDNKPYTAYNYADSTYGASFDPAHPLNKSPNNTGLAELPPAQPAMIWYPYGLSEEFPLLQGGQYIVRLIFLKQNALSRIITKANGWLLISCVAGS
jgi:cytochrome c